MRRRGSNYRLWALSWSGWEASGQLPRSALDWDSISSLGFSAALWSNQCCARCAGWSVDGYWSYTLPYPRWYSSSPTISWVHWKSWVSRQSWRRSCWANRIVLPTACSPPWLHSRFDWSSHWSLYLSRYSFRSCGSSSGPEGISVWPSRGSARNPAAASWIRCSWFYSTPRRWVLPILSLSTRWLNWWIEDSLQVGSANPAVRCSVVPSMTVSAAPSLFLHTAVLTGDLHPQQFDILGEWEQSRHVPFQFVEHLFVGSQWQFIALHQVAGGELVGPPAGIRELEGLGSW